MSLDPREEAVSSIDRKELMVFGDGSLSVGFIAALQDAYVEYKEVEKESDKRKHVIVCVREGGRLIYYTREGWVFMMRAVLSRSEWARTVVDTAEIPPNILFALTRYPTAARIIFPMLSTASTRPVPPLLVRNDTSVTPDAFEACTYAVLATVLPSPTPVTPVFASVIEMRLMKQTAKLSGLAPIPPLRNEFDAIPLRQCSDARPVTSKTAKKYALPVTACRVSVEHTARLFYEQGLPLSHLLLTRGGDTIDVYRLVCVPAALDGLMDAVTRNHNAIFLLDTAMKPYLVLKRGTVLVRACTMKQFRQMFDCVSCLSTHIFNSEDFFCDVVVNKIGGHAYGASDTTRHLVRKILDMMCRDDGGCDYIRNSVLQCTTEPQYRLRIFSAEVFMPLCIGVAAILICPGRNMYVQDVMLAAVYEWSCFIDEYDSINESRRWKKVLMHLKLGFTRTRFKWEQIDRSELPTALHDVPLSPTTVFLTLATQQMTPDGMFRLRDHIFRQQRAAEVYTHPIYQDALEVRHALLCCWTNTAQLDVRTDLPLHPNPADVHPRCNKVCTDGFYVLTSATYAVMTGATTLEQVKDRFCASEANDPGDSVFRVNQFPRALHEYFPHSSRRYEDTQRKKFNYACTPFRHVYAETDVVGFEVELRVMATQLMVARGSDVCGVGIRGFR